MFSPNGGGARQVKCLLEEEQTCPRRWGRESQSMVSRRKFNAIDYPHRGGSMRKCKFFFALFIFLVAVMIFNAEIVRPAVTGSVLGTVDRKSTRLTSSHA